jgi:hypothetical protein
MTTADLLSERASALARSDSSNADAINELLVFADGHRVSVVRARQKLAAASGGGDDAASEANRAMALLQAVLDQMPA